MVLSTLLALLLQNAMQLFNLLLVFGAGTGLIFILRWFWWRINAWSEITAMVASGLISLTLTIPSIKVTLFGIEGFMPSWAEFPFVVSVTTILWLLITFITPSEDESVLRSFYKKTQPGGPGWAKIVGKAQKEGVERLDDNKPWDTSVDSSGKAPLKPFEDGKDLINKFTNQWKLKLKILKKINWRKNNPVWNNRVLINGRVVKNNSSIILASNVIKKALGLSLNSKEKALESKVKKNGK